MRKDYQDLESLKQSIKVLGLLQPIVVNENNELICGGRRLQACKELGLDDIPVVVFKPNLEMLEELDDEERQRTLEEFVRKVS